MRPWCKALTLLALTISTGWVWAQATPTDSLLNNSQNRVMLDESIRRGLNFLNQWQNPDGSWDRLEAADPFEQNDPAIKTKMHNGLYYFDGPVKDIPENQEVAHVADTCLSGLAMLRSGSTPAKGPYARQIAKAMQFVCLEIDKWDEKTIYIQKRIFDPLHDTTTSRGEQRYYDPTVDAFFALWFLSAGREQLPAGALHQRTDAAIAKLVHKIVAAQNADGAWPDETDPTINLHRTPFEQKSLMGIPLANGGGTVGILPKPEEPFFEPYPNVTSHAVAVLALSEAVRHGVGIPAATRRQADMYLVRGVNSQTLEDLIVLCQEGADQPYPFSKIDNIVTGYGSLLAALWASDQLDATLLEQATRQLETAIGDESRTLKQRIAGMAEHRKRTAPARNEALTRFAYFRGLKGQVKCGPLLVMMPHLFDMLQSSQVNSQFHPLMIDYLLDKQFKADGHFRAGREPLRGATDRGDSTYGTAASLLILMDQRDRLDNASRRP